MIWLVTGFADPELLITVVITNTVGVVRPSPPSVVVTTTEFGVAAAFREQ